MNPLAFESLYTVFHDPLPDAEATTTPDAAVTNLYADSSAPTKGLTTQGQRKAVTDRLEQRQLRLVQNTFRRATAFDYDEDFYKALKVRERKAA